MTYRTTKRSVLVLFFVAGLAYPVIPAFSQQQPQPKSDTKEKSSALTGCVDEQDGHYVLIDPRTMTPVANLLADGFQTESFAKHVGHTVTVRGTSSSTGTRPTFKVRSIETLSQSCEPHE